MGESTDRPKGNSLVKHPNLKINFLNSNSVTHGNPIWSSTDSQTGNLNLARAVLKFLNSKYSKLDRPILTRNDS